MVDFNISELVSCTSCGEPSKPGNRFCADCGAKLPVPGLSDTTNCRSCGSTSGYDQDGFCIDCGARMQSTRDQEAQEAIGDGLAAMTDTGKTHKRNDDAFSLFGSPLGGHGTILVICDGVSNSQAPDLASVAASKATCEYIEKNYKSAKSEADVEKIVKQAIILAHTVVCGVPFDRQADLDPPAATIAIAVVLKQENLDPRVCVGWLGDSRVYSLSLTQPSKMLTRDHSWVNAMVDEGIMTEEVAKKDKKAHYIVKCLGSSDFHKPTECPEPSVKTVTVPHDSWLLACTDGLWNYAETAGDLLKVANGPLRAGSALDACKRYVDFALMSGGHDNVTVALAKV